MGGSHPWVECYSRTFVDMVVDMSRSLFVPQQHVLDNSVPVVIDSVTSVDSVAIGLWVRAGTRDEPRGKAGLAHMVEHMSFRGTKRRTHIRTSRAIAREFDNLGAYANAYTTKEETVYYVRCLRDHLPKVVGLLSDILVHPSLSADDLAKEREVIAEEIRSYEDEAEEYIFDLAEQYLFGNHPFGMPIVGTLESIQSLSTSDVRSFHRDRYTTSSVVVTVAGNVDVERFLDQVRSGLAYLPPGQHRHRRRKPHVRPAQDVRLPWQSQQAHVLWHRATDGHRSTSRAALSLLNVVLGDGMSSRLNIRVRESHSIAYSVYSQLQLFTDVGMLAMYAGMDERNIGRTERMFEQELVKLAAQGVRPSELRRAKEQVRASRLMSLESLSSRMSLLGKGMLDDRRPEDPFRAIDEVMAVSLDEINALCAAICDPATWHRLALVPMKKG